METPFKVTAWDVEDGVIKSIKLGHIVYPVISPILGDLLPLSLGIEFSKCFDIFNARTHYGPKAPESQPEPVKIQTTLSMVEPEINSMPDTFRSPLNNQLMHKNLLIRLYDAFKNSPFTIASIMERFRDKDFRQFSSEMYRNHVRFMELQGWVESTRKGKALEYRIVIPIEEWKKPSEFRTEIE